MLKVCGQRGGDRKYSSKKENRGWIRENMLRFPESIKAWFMVPSSSVGRESVCNAGDPGSIPGLGRSPGEGIDYPL